MVLETKRPQRGSLPRRWTQSTGGTQNLELVNAVAELCNHACILRNLWNFKVAFLSLLLFLSLPELSTGLLTFTQLGQKDDTDHKVLLLSVLSVEWLMVVIGFIFKVLSDTVFFTQVQMLPMTAEEGSAHSDGMDSDRFSGSNASFLANEKLMSVDSMNSDITGMICIETNLFFIFKSECLLKIQTVFSIWLIFNCTLVARCF